MLVCWNKEVEAMHLMRAAKHVLCQSSLNSSLRHCSSTGFLSNQLAGTLLVWIPQQREKRDKDKQGSRPGGSDWRLKDPYLCWEQHSPGHAHQAVLLGTQQSTYWHFEGCKLKTTWHMSVNTPLTEKGRVCFCFFYCAGLWWQNSLHCPKRLLQVTISSTKPRINTVTSQMHSTSTSGDFMSKPLLNESTSCANTYSWKMILLIKHILTVSHFKTPGGDIQVWYCFIWQHLQHQERRKPAPIPACHIPTFCHARILTYPDA